MATKKASDGAEVVELQRLQEGYVELEIIGLTPYIPHRWDEKVKRMMPGHPDKPQVAAKKAAHDPEAEASACVYRLADGRPGIPATAIKAAMVGGCRLLKGMPMVEAKVAFHVVGEGPEQLVPFIGTPILREDTPRNANGGADLRYRYMFTEWRATVRISYVASVITENSIVALLDAGGRGGVGDWRPSAPKSFTGTYGMWRLATEEGAS